MKHFNLEGVEYFQLLIPCPACIEREKPTQTSLWTHTNCGGDMYVGENAFYRCVVCKREWPVMEMEYSCPNHPNGEFYKLTDGKYLLNAMTVAGEIVKNDGGVKFMRKFSASLDDYMDSHKS